MSEVTLADAPLMVERLRTYKYPSAAEEMLIGVWDALTAAKERAEKAEVVLKIVSEGLKVWPPDKRPMLVAAQVLLGPEGLKMLHDALLALGGREEKPDD